MEEFTDGITRGGRLLCPWLDTQSVLVYSWPDNHTLGRFRAPRATLETRMDKNFVFLRIPETRMARGDRKVIPEHHRYVEKWF